MKIIFSSLKNRRIQDFLFVLLLLLVYVFYNYHEILFLRPQGIHFIRQTDSLSFVTGYYKYGMNFFEPKGLNLLSEDGKGVSEFPILYYITACLYFVFGEKEFILRMLNIIIVSFGFYFLFKLLRSLVKDVFYAYVFTFLFLSSTVLIYYTNNFLPDSSALGFTLIGWYYYYDYMYTSKSKKLILSFSFFTISSLLKVTFFMNPVSAFLTLFYFHLIEKNKDGFKFPVWVFSFSLFFNLIWVIFVWNYNLVNNNNYFTTDIRPIWNLTSEGVNDVWDHVSNFWYTKYYFQSTFHLMSLIVLLGVIFHKKIKIELLVPAIFLILGGTFYVLFFYEMFKDHDYYFITILPIIIIIIITSFTGIQNKFPRVINHFLLKLIILAVVLLSINYSKKKFNQRYENSFEGIPQVSLQLQGIDEYLVALNVDEFSKIVVVKDLSRNGSLYVLNRQGWLLNSFSKLNDRTLSNYVDKGAEYLILTDLYQVPEISKSWIEIGRKNKVSIFKFRGNK